METQTRLAAGLVAAALLGAGTALAHDASMHKGKATRGTVAAVSAGELTVETEKGRESFVLSADTEVERGEKKAGAGDLKQGDEVAVFGTKLPGGKTAASQVVVESGDAGEKCGGDTRHGR